MEKRFGKKAYLPWNRHFFGAMGPLIEKIDPYFPLANSLHIVGKTFADLGVIYEGCCHHHGSFGSPNKTPNGFMHIPSSSYVNEEGCFSQPALASVFLVLLGKAEPAKKLSECFA